jgi:hypothetical protein
VVIEGEEEYEVEWVDDSRLFRRQLQYLVKWRDNNKRSWEHVANVDRLKVNGDFSTEQAGKSGL